MQSLIGRVGRSSGESLESSESSLEGGDGEGRICGLEGDGDSECHMKEGGFRGAGGGFGCFGSSRAPVRGGEGVLGGSCFGVGDFSDSEESLGGLGIARTLVFCSVLGDSEGTLRLRAGNEGMRGSEGSRGNEGIMKKCPSIRRSDTTSSVS